MLDTTCRRNNGTVCGKPSVEKWSQIKVPNIVLYFCEDHKLSWHISEDLRNGLSSAPSGSWYPSSN